MTDLFGRLRSPRKRVMSGRHLQILNLMLDVDEITLVDLTTRTRHFYALKNPHKALIRDFNYLIQLQAIQAKPLPEDGGFLLSVRLEWPTQITETDFFRRVKEMPTIQHLQMIRQVLREEREITRLAREGSQPAGPQQELL